MMKYRHTPVLLNEVIEYLNPRPNQNFIDCTLGGGGHATEILKKTAPEGKLLGFDLETKAIKSFQEKIKEENINPERIILVQKNFKNLKSVAAEHFKGVPVDGIVLDLGLSTDLIEESGRGFSFQKDEPLDMRFDAGQKLTAKNIVNGWPEGELFRIFKDYGEEKHSYHIAKMICRARRGNKIDTTQELVDLIRKFVPPAKKENKGHLARIFQALRIAVNGELENLQSVLEQAAEILSPKGRLAVISFHSLEDRIVKQFFARESKDCVCPLEFPICQCHHKASLKIITKKPIVPTEEEIRTNPRSRSARLRVAEKLGN